MQKVTLTLEEEILKFVDRRAKGNRSAYINALLAEHRRMLLKEEIIAALIEDTADENYLSEIAAWDNTTGDGID